MCCDLLIVSKNLLAEDHCLILITSIDVAGRLRAAVCNAFIGMFISCKKQHLKKKMCYPHIQQTLLLRMRVRVLDENNSLCCLDAE